MLTLDIELNGIEDEEVSKVLEKGRLSSKKKPSLQSPISSAAGLGSQSAEEQVLLSQHDKYSLPLLH